MSYLDIENVPGRYKASDGKAFFMDYEKRGKGIYDISRKFTSVTRAN